jgi:hypothetical protein
VARGGEGRGGEGRARERAREREKLCYDRQRTYGVNTGDTKYINWGGEEEEAKDLQGEYTRHMLHNVFSIECVLYIQKLEKVGNAQRERMMKSKGV